MRKLCSWTLHCELVLLSWKISLVISETTAAWNNSHNCNSGLVPVERDYASNCSFRSGFTSIFQNILHLLRRTLILKSYRWWTITQDEVLTVCGFWNWSSSNRICILSSELLNLPLIWLSWGDWYHQCLEYPFGHFVLCSKRWIPQWLHDMLILVTEVLSAELTLNGKNCTTNRL